MMVNKDNRTIPFIRIHFSSYLFSHTLAAGNKMDWTYNKLSLNARKTGPIFFHSKFNKNLNFVNVFIILISMVFD